MEKSMLSEIQSLSPFLLVSFNQRNKNTNTCSILNVLPFLAVLGNHKAIARDVRYELNLPYLMPWSLFRDGYKPNNFNVFPLITLLLELRFSSEVRAGKNNRHLAALNEKVVGSSNNSPFGFQQLSVPAISAFHKAGITKSFAQDFGSVLFPISTTIFWSSKVVNYNPNKNLVDFSHIDKTTFLHGFRLFNFAQLFFPSRRRRQDLTALQSLNGYKLIFPNNDLVRTLSPLSALVFKSTGNINIRNEGTRYSDFFKNKVTLTRLLIPSLLRRKDLNAPPILNGFKLNVPNNKAAGDLFSLLTNTSRTIGQFKTIETRIADVSEVNFTHKKKLDEQLHSPHPYQYAASPFKQWNLISGSVENIVKREVTKATKELNLLDQNQSTHQTDVVKLLSVALVRDEVIKLMENKLRSLAEDEQFRRGRW